VSAGDKAGLISVKLKMTNSSVADARRTEDSLLRSATLFQLVTIKATRPGIGLTSRRFPHIGFGEPVIRALAKWSAIGKLADNERLAWATCQNPRVPATRSRHKTTALSKSLIGVPKAGGFGND
jgi:hypothetical protein